MEKNLLDTYLDYHSLTILPRKGAKEPRRDGMPFMPMFVFYPCDYDLYNNLTCYIGQTLGFKLSNSNCVIQLKIKN